MANWPPCLVLLLLTMKFISSTTGRLFSLPLSQYSFHFKSDVQQFYAHPHAHISTRASQQRQKQVLLSTISQDSESQARLGSTACRLRWRSSFSACGNAFLLGLSWTVYFLFFERENTLCFSTSVFDAESNTDTRPPSSMCGHLRACVRACVCVCVCACVCMGGYTRACVCRYQALYEGFRHHAFSYYSAVIFWKSQSPWPALRGAFYDSYLDTTGGFWGVHNPTLSFLCYV